MSINDAIREHGAPVVDLSNTPKDRNMTYEEVKALVAGAPRAVPLGARPQRKPVFSGPSIKVIPRQTSKGELRRILPSSFAFPRLPHFLSLSVPALGIVWLLLGGPITVLAVNMLSTTFGHYGWIAGIVGAPFVFMAWIGLPVILAKLFVR